MKFINYLQSISGVGIYPLASLLMFTTFFGIVAIWVFYIDNGLVKHMKNIPLDETETTL